MIQCEKWEEPKNARYLFDDDDIKTIKSAISHMRSSVNRLEQEYTKQRSFENGLQLDEIVRLHNYLGMLFTQSCSFLERVSSAEYELASYLNETF